MHMLGCHIYVQILEGETTVVFIERDQLRIIKTHAGLSWLLVRLYQEQVSWRHFMKMTVALPFKISNILCSGGCGLTATLCKASPHQSSLSC
jgi:hypothetical protein